MFRDQPSWLRIILIGALLAIGAAIGMALLSVIGTTLLFLILT